MQVIKNPGFYTLAFVIIWFLVYGLSIFLFDKKYYFSHGVFYGKDSICKLEIFHFDEISGSLNGNFKFLFSQN